MFSTAKELKTDYELLNETPAETLAGDAPKADENSAPDWSKVSTVRQDIGKVS